MVAPDDRCQRQIEFELEMQRVKRMADRLGVPGNLELARAFIALIERVEMLEYYANKYNED